MIRYQENIICIYMVQGKIVKNMETEKIVKNIEKSQQILKIKFEGYSVIINNLDILGLKEIIKHP